MKLHLVAVRLGVGTSVRSHTCFGKVGRDAQPHGPDRYTGNISFCIRKLVQGPRSRFSFLPYSLMSLATEEIDTPSAPDSTALPSSTPGGLTSEPTDTLMEAAATPHVRFPEPQAAYLKSKIPEYKRAQADKSWDDTWASIHGGFIHEWPQGPLTAAEIAAGVTIEDKLVQELKVNQQFSHEQQK